MNQLKLCTQLINELKRRFKNSDTSKEGMLTYEVMRDIISLKCNNEDYEEFK
jgi:hypothetical protein